MDANDVVKLLNEESYLHDPIQFDIDNDLRIVAIPKDGNIIGVVGDKNTNRVNFRMPRYYNGFDMSEFKARVNYKNANQKVNYYEVNDLTTAVSTNAGEDEKLLFTWLVDSDACEAVGNVEFSVRLLKTDDAGTISQEFNTTTAVGIVLTSIDAYESGIKSDVDLLNRLRKDVYMDVLNKIGGSGGGGGSTALPIVSTYSILDGEVSSNKLIHHTINKTYTESTKSSETGINVAVSVANNIATDLFDIFNEILIGMELTGTFPDSPTGCRSTHGCSPRRCLPCF